MPKPPPIPDFPVVYDAQSRQPDKLHPDILDKALAEGTHTFAAGVKVPVIGPDGQAGTIPAENIQAAIKAGYRTETPEQAHTRRYLKENEGAVGASKVAIGKFGSEALFGVPEIIGEAVAEPQSVKDWEALKDENKWTSGIASVAGGITSLALPGGGAFKASETAGRGVETALVPSKLKAIEEAAELATAHGVKHDHGFNAILELKKLIGGDKAALSPESAARAKAMGMSPEEYRAAAEADAAEHAAWGNDVGNAKDVADSERNRVLRAAGREERPIVHEDIKTPVVNLQVEPSAFAPASEASKASEEFYAKNANPIGGESPERPFNAPLGPPSGDQQAQGLEYLKKVRDALADGKPIPVLEAVDPEARFAGMKATEEAKAAELAAWQKEAARSPSSVAAGRPTADLNNAAAPTMTSAERSGLAPGRKAIDVVIEKAQAGLAKARSTSAELDAWLSEGEIPSWLKAAHEQPRPYADTVLGDAAIGGRINPNHPTMLSKGEVRPALAVADEVGSGAIKTPVLADVAKKLAEAEVVKQQKVVDALLKDFVDGGDLGYVPSSSEDLAEAFHALPSESKAAGIGVPMKFNLGMEMREFKAAVDADPALQAFYAKKYGMPEAELLKNRAKLAEEARKAVEAATGKSTKGLSDEAVEAVHEVVKAVHTEEAANVAFKEEAQSAMDAGAKDLKTAGLAVGQPSLSRTVETIGFRLTSYAAQGAVLAAPRAAAYAFTGDPEKAAEALLWGAIGGGDLGLLSLGSRYGRGSAAFIAGKTIELASSKPVVHAAQHLAGHALGAAIGYGVGGAGMHGVGAMLGANIGGKSVVANVLSTMAKTFRLRGRMQLAENYMMKMARQPMAPPFAQFVAASGTSVVDQMMSRVPAMLTSLAFSKASLRVPAEKTTSQSIPNVEQFHKDAAVLAHLANDMGAISDMAAHIGSVVADDHSTDAVHAALAGKLASTITYLHNAAPKQSQVDVPFSTYAWNPSPQELRSFYAKLGIAHDPFSALDRYQDGTLTRDHVEALAALYPTIYQQLQSTVMQVAASKKPPKLSYPDRIMLSLLIGVPLDPTLKPGHMQSLQQVFTQDSPQPTPQGGGKGPSRRASKVTNYPSLATESQIVLGGGRK